MDGVQAPAPGRRLGNYADIIGTHLYGGQVIEGSIGKLKSYMAEYGDAKQITCSECGADQNWYTGNGYWKGAAG